MADGGQLTTINSTRQCKTSDASPTMHEDIIVIIVKKKKKEQHLPVPIAISHMHELAPKSQPRHLGSHRRSHAAGPIFVLSTSE